jgi:hypothetical protein
MSAADEQPLKEENELLRESSHEQEAKQDFPGSPGASSASDTRSA